VRLFVAVDIGDEARAQLRRVRTALEQRLAAATRAPRVTWVAGEAAHVTVRFIGEVPDATADRVRGALAAPFPVEAYDLELSGAGAFPNHRRPRVVWIAITTGQLETAQVAKAVNARLEPIIGPAEDRPFRAHLTVARVKELVPFDWDAALKGVEAGRTVSRIDRVTLYQSRTSPKGPTYTALCTTALAIDDTRH
jgi:RNA 2',3'-cyclic 3'-phosphodiesterase